MKTLWKTLCVENGKTYLIISKIEKQLNGSYLATGKNNEGKNCIIRWWHPAPVDVSEPSDWEEADEIVWEEADEIIVCEQ